MDEEAIEQQKGLCGGENSEAWRREFLCIRERNTVSLVVPEFCDTKHVKAINAPSKAFWQVAGDYGGSRDHFHAVLCCWDFLRAKMLVLREAHFLSGTPNSVIAPALKQMGEGFVVARYWLDVPGQTAVDLQKDYGLLVTLPQKQDADAALNALRLAFTNNQIEISPECVKTIGCVSAALWNRNRTDWERTEKHGHADALAAMVYAWRMLDKRNPYPTEYDPKVWTHPDNRIKASGLQSVANLINKGRRR
jgi:hypothetical protein